MKRLMLLGLFFAFHSSAGDEKDSGKPAPPPTMEEIRCQSRKPSTPCDGRWACEIFWPEGRPPYTAWICHVSGS